MPPSCENRPWPREAIWGFRFGYVKYIVYETVPALHQALAKPSASVVDGLGRDIGKTRAAVLRAANHRERS
jgi:hypothetical protein